MSRSHASVHYVEPNYFLLGKDDKDAWRVDDAFERSPRLEDYCIAMNIEVEVYSRDNVLSSEKSASEVLILQYTNTSEKQSVSFMGGTRIGGYNMDGVKSTPRLSGTYNALTTYYADMYVGDLIDYGTSEMVGIKSVDITYEKSCVPSITVRFTDVRGMSLFQPTELSRTNSYQGIRGINADNVAQSFFQCFFKMPYPKFTIYLKGFYGEPVSYEVMCDKFDTDFNSDNGDFDVTARFIGYNYAFLTDVTMDALLAAPYADYIGRKYWEDQVANGRFAIRDASGEAMMKMPTLYEMHTHIKRLLKESNSEMMDTTLDEEEVTHANEIARLNDIRQKYQVWYETLYTIAQAKYGKRAVYAFREVTADGLGDYYRIVVLANSSNNENNLGDDFMQYADEFKRMNLDLYQTVASYNDSGSAYRQLDNVSIDFTDYVKRKLFKPCYVSKTTRKIEFGGFSKDMGMSRNEVVRVMFNDSIKDYTLSAIYFDGVNQYTDGFVIEADYTDIKRRINYLQADANKSLESKEAKKRRKEHNRIMIGKMNWYPSVENFTKIMMAHLETFMAMMYGVANAVKDRTPSSLGISVGEDGDACDVPKDAHVVPPFPRVTKVTTYDNAQQKREDAWVGDYDQGEGFKEVDMVNSLFNAVEALDEMAKRDNEVLAALDSSRNSEESVPMVKLPLMPSDLFLTKTVYGTDEDALNNPNALCGKIAMRMFDLLCINPFKQQYGKEFANENVDFIKAVAESEAYNFYDSVILKSPILLEMIGKDEDTSTIKSRAVYDLLVKSKTLGDGFPIPWRYSSASTSLFSADMWLTKYYTPNGKTAIYPMQDISFDRLSKAHNYFSQGEGKIDAQNGDIFVSWVNVPLNYKMLMASPGSGSFGNVEVFDDITKIASILNNATSTSSDSYKKVFETIGKGMSAENSKVEDCILDGGVFIPKRNAEVLDYCGTLSVQSNTKIPPMYIYVDEKSKKPTNVSNGVKLEYTYEKPQQYLAESKGGRFTSSFISDMYGWKIDKKTTRYALNKDESLFCLFNMQNLSDHWEGSDMDADDIKLAFVVMCTSCICYKEVAKRLEENAMAFIPRLAVLQIGAALSTLGTKLDKDVSEDSISMFLPLPSDDFKYVIKYLNSINPLVRLAYVKYFRTWAEQNKGDLLRELEAKPTNKNYAMLYKVQEGYGGNIAKGLFNEASDKVNELSYDLMRVVCVIRGSVNHFKGLTRKGLEINQGVVINYMDAFFGKLRELYNLAEPKGKNGSVVRQAAEPKKTTDAMRIELYRYLKLLYDKWIPSNTQESWNFETFFDSSKDSKLSNSSGHLFHFIDSYYNKIGQKLLINPSALANEVDKMLNAKDTNVTLHSFLSGIYSLNKCMLMAIQNFSDLSDTEAMKKMFTPIAYNDMRKPRKHPDFVVVYPYEPSKNLNVNNAEFNDDSFMLNDEAETPLAIRSRADEENGYYRIPAFGVSYGKQYQSYFKSVKVDMKNPIATEQMLKAKHSILRASQDGSTKGTQAQDLYNIYTTQSYTCTVEMMGCAWVQPLMYFVLTNIPMFRGSYLIMRVTHSLRPGDMTTTFMGTRMANVSNALVDEIFTDEDIDETPQAYAEGTRDASEMADTSNDCAYKTFPLFEVDLPTELSGDDQADGLSIMDKLISVGFTEIAAAGIVGNMYVESYDYLNTKKRFKYDLVVKDSGTSGGLCMWRNGNLDDLVNKRTQKLGHNSKFITYSNAVRDEYSAKLRKIGLDYQIEFLKNTMTSTRENGNYAPLKFDVYNEVATTPRVAAETFQKRYERPAKLDSKRADAAEKFYDLHHNKSKQVVEPSEPRQNPNTPKEVCDAFTKALQRSVNSTSRGEVKLKFVRGTSKVKDDTIVISQANGKNDQMAFVFDVIVNGYYQNVQRVWWLYEGANGFMTNASFINVIPKVSVDATSRRITANNRQSISNTNSTPIDASYSEDFLRALAKLRKRLGDKAFLKDVPQLNGNNVSILDKYEPTDCANCGGRSYGTTTTRDNVEKPSDVSTSTVGYVGDWNVEKGLRQLNSTDKTKSIGECARYVENAIEAGFDMKVGSTIKCGSKYATNLRYRGILEGKVKVGNGKALTYKMIDSGMTNKEDRLAHIPLQPGDVAVIGRDVEKGEGGKYHACMWSGSEWISDFRQGNKMNPYWNYVGELPYAIYRNKNAKITTYKA